MRKCSRKIVSIILVICFILSTSITAFAKSTDSSFETLENGTNDEWVQEPETIKPIQKR